MSSQPIRVAVIIGSTRSGRFAPTVAKWFVGEAEKRDDMTIDVIDLAEAKLPEKLSDVSYDSDDETIVARRLAAADSFVIVTPEYNHSFPASIKSAIDWHYDEWHAKPVAFVSYGGQSGGLRAVEHLRTVFAEVHATTIRDTVSFHGASQRFDADGTPREPEFVNAAAKTLLDQLAWWALALKEARVKRPYSA